MSPGFSFSLEPLLRLRKAREERRLSELAQTQQQLQRACAALKKLEAALAGAVAVMGRTGCARAAEYDRAASDARTAVVRCEENVRAAAVALADARRETKAIELLKTRRLAEHRAARARKEERELDEANHR